MKTTDLIKKLIGKTIYEMFTDICVDDEEEMMHIKSAKYSSKDKMYILTASKKDTESTRKSMTIPAWIVEELIKKGTCIVNNLYGFGGTSRFDLE